jgi:Protein of unknown function (DUF3253)
MSDLNHRLETAILDLLEQRGPGKTICPSEVARHVDSSAKPEGWRSLMEPVRNAAQRLVAAGEIEITQRGRAVDPAQAKGAIRLRKK